VLAIQQILSDR